MVRVYIIMNGKITCRDFRTVFSLFYKTLFRQNIFVGLTVAVAPLVTQWVTIKQLSDWESAEIFVTLFYKYGFFLLSHVRAHIFQIQNTAWTINFYGLQRMQGHRQH